MGKKFESGKIKGEKISSWAKQFELGKKIQDGQKYLSQAKKFESGKKI